MLLRDFKEQMSLDVKDIFLQEFATQAIYKSRDTLKEVTVQFFEQSLDQLDTTFFHAWASYSEISDIQKNDTLEINGTVYGVVDLSPDEFGDGVNIFLQEV